MIDIDKVSDFKTVNNTNKSNKVSQNYNGTGTSLITLCPLP